MQARGDKIKTENMTAGNPWRILLLFSLPLMFGNVFQQIYIFIDTLVVGQFLGINALAAMGGTEWLIFLVMASVQGITQGFSIVMAQKFGAGDEKGFRKAVQGGAYLMGLLLVLFTFGGQMLITPVLSLLRTPAAVMVLAVRYLRVLFMGIPVMWLYHYLAGILRAVGNSRIPLRAMAVTAIENVILDFFFVVGLKWEMEGAALATVLSLLTAAVYCLVQVKKSGWLVFDKSSWRPEGEILRQHLRSGLPIGLQNIITALGGLVLQAVINGFGVTFMAGYTAAGKLYVLLESAASSYGYAMNTFAGQNMGAGDYRRLRRGLLAGSGLGVITAGVMSAVMVLFGRGILQVFLQGDRVVAERAVAYGYQFLVLLALFFPLLYLLYILRAWIQGVGYSAWAMLSSIVQLIMRVGCALRWYG